MQDHSCSISDVAKRSFVTVRLGSKYASVIINLKSTSATQLYSKTIKIKKAFIGTPHFFLNLVQKRRNNKPSSFQGPHLAAHREQFMSNESPTQIF